MERLRDGEFDLVLTDFGMPDVSGVEVVESAKELHPETSVAVLSGWSEESLRDRFTDSRMPDWILKKPIDMAALSTLLSRCADTNPAESRCMVAQGV